MLKIKNLMGFMKTRFNPRYYVILRFLVVDINDIIKAVENSTERNNSRPPSLLDFEKDLTWSKYKSTVICNFLMRLKKTTWNPPSQAR